MTEQTHSCPSRAARINHLRRSIARRALAAYGMRPTSILSVTISGGLLVVATYTVGAELPYAVDGFRLPTAAEVAPEQDAPLRPGEWVLIDQHGAYDAERVNRMVAEALDYGRPLVARLVGRRGALAA